jgi:hypothetical protein
MPINGFSVGRDVSLDIVGPAGPVRFNLITKFTSKQDVKDNRVKGIDGITRPVRFFDGWTGGFDIERQDSTVDDYFSQLEANYYAGLNEASVTITETITEVSGAITQYRYVGVLLKLDDAGDYAGDSTVKQKISFVASRRLKVA